MNRFVSRGWHKESYRHSLAARGISTSKFRRSFMPVNLYENYDKDLEIYGGKTLQRFNELSPSEQFEARKEYYDSLAENDDDKERFYTGLVHQQTKLEQEWKDKMRREGFDNMPEALFDVGSDGDITLGDGGFAEYIGVPRQQYFGDINMTAYLVSHDPLDFARDTNPFHFDIRGLESLPSDIDRLEFKKKIQSLALSSEKEERAKKIIESLVDLQKEMHKATYEWKIDDSQLQDKYFDADTNGEVHIIRDVIPVANAPKEMHLVPAPDQWELERMGESARIKVSYK